MLAYTVRRLLIMIPTLFAISVLVFIIIQLPPGDFLETQLEELRASGESSNMEKIEFLRKQFGLDQPMITQYAIWAGVWPGENGFTGMLQGNLGYSFEYNKPVAEIVGESIWLTVVVSVATIIFTWVVSFPIGIYSATHQYSWGDHSMTFLGFLGLAVPNFLFALVLLYLANVYLGTSIGGLMEPQYLDQPLSWGKALSILEHLWVPVVVIGTSGTAGMIRRLRANLLDELQKQYVTTGRAKGLTPGRLLWKYPLRMALNPFISDIGSLLPQLISGAVIVSVVMNLPTTGPLLLRALQTQDQFLAGSFLMLLAVLTVIGMFISDLALAALDPRIRLTGGTLR